MLEILRTSESQSIILTLTELVTIEDPYYLFVFNSNNTKDQVKFIKSVADDLSSYQYRYNKFTINPSEVFADVQRGLYAYTVYEQASSNNLDPAGLRAIEYGKMRLLDTELEYAEYDERATFKTYDG